MTTKKQFNSFEEMLSGSDVPVLVDFHADWCGVFLPLRLCFFVPLRETRTCGTVVKMFFI